MAEQESKKVDENNVEETSESETKTVSYQFDICSIYFGVKMVQVCLLRP
jgi:hypothetical protein